MEHKATTDKETKAETATVSIEGESVLLRLPISAKNATKAGLDVRYELYADCQDCQIRVGHVTGDRIWPKNLALGHSYIDKETFRVTMRAITALTILCKEKSMRQAARICAWLIGADISRMFGSTYVINMTDVGALAIDMDQAFLLARIMRNGQMHTKQIECIDPRVETMLWCGIKAVATLSLDNKLTRSLCDYEVAAAIIRTIA